MKRIFSFVSLSLAATIASATILDLGDITRDTDTGLDWLDVTETRGLSYNQVMAQMTPGGTLEGWRYATTAELDQLIINFGYTALNTCAGTQLHCDANIPGDSPVIENFIKTMGDTWDANVDSFVGPYDTDGNGAGWTQGLIDGNNVATAGGTDWAMVGDSEHVFRSTGAPFSDADDNVETAYGGFTLDQSSAYIGSFLVKTTEPDTAVNVPIPFWAASVLAILLALSLKLLPIKTD